MAPNLLPTTIEDDDAAGRTVKAVVVDRLAVATSRATPRTNFMVVLFGSGWKVGE